MSNVKKCCGNHFCTIGSYQYHKIEFHEKVTVSIPRIIPPYCEFCDKYYWSVDELEYHENIEHDKIIGINLNPKRMSFSNTRTPSTENISKEISLEEISLEETSLEEISLEEISPEGL